MNLQFVFGNPTRKAKKKKVSNKGGPVAKRRKKVRRKNPYVVKSRVYDKATKKTLKVKGASKTATIMTPGEKLKARAAIKVASEKVKLLPPKKRKAVKARIRKLRAALAKRVLKDKLALETMRNDMESLKDIKVVGGQKWAKETDFEMTQSYKAPGSKRKKKKVKKVARRKKKSKKAKATRRKAKSRKASRRRSRKSGGSRRSIVLKRRGSKVKIKSAKGRSAPGITVSKASNPKRKKRKGSKRRSTKQQSKRRSSRRRSITLAGRRKSVRVKVRKGKKSASFRIKANPLGGIMGQFENYTGHSVAEAGSLALGGALYGAVNGAVARYAKPVHAMLAKVPVVGTSLPTLLAGALMNYLGERQNIAALRTIGKGLVGASVVGMGVNASQMVPGLKAMAGVDFTMEGLGDDGQMGEIPYSGYGDEADFGLLPEGMGDDSGADFGGVDYTMEGVDYTMEGYGDDADFGSVPEGLGQGQMG